MTTPANDTLTTTAVAERLGADPKTLRVFLRSTSKGVGSGSRYSLTAKDVAPLKANSPSGPLNAGGLPRLRPNRYGQRVTRKKWHEDDNLVVARLVLVVNAGDPNPVVPLNHPEYIRARNALGINDQQLIARVNMFRSNLPGWVGARSGNAMHADDAILQRVLGQMSASPGYVKTCGNAILERLEED
jgi:hypothetical protein